MKLNWLSGALALLLVGTACQSEQPVSRREAQFAERAEQGLSDEQMFDKDQVQQYLFALEALPGADTLRANGSKNYNEAVAAYVQQNDIARAKNLLITSIKTYPSPQGYLMLSYAAMDSRDYSMAEKALSIYRDMPGMSEAKNGLAQARLYALKALAEGKTDVVEWGIWQGLEQAVKGNELTLTDFNRDTVFNWVRNHETFQAEGNRIFNQQPRTFGFTEFVAEFPEMRGNRYRFTTDSLQNIGNEANGGMGYSGRALDFQYAPFIREMEATYYGRGVSNAYMPLAVLKREATYTAVAYANIELFGHPVQPKHVIVMTFNNQGEQIDRLNVACVCSGTEIKTFDYQDGVMLIHDGEPKWQRPLGESESGDNPLTGMREIGTRSYEFAADGRIVRIEAN